MATPEELQMLELQALEVLKLLEKVFEYLYEDKDFEDINTVVSEMLSRTQTVIQGINDGAYSQQLLESTKSIYSRYEKLEQLIKDQKNITATQLQRSQQIVKAMKGYSQDNETEQKQNPIYYDKKG